MKRKKRAVTLIEIMIVILLIGLIGGALAFNMRGSVDEGRAFKTEQNINRLHDILMLEYAKGDKTLDEIQKQHATIAANSPLGKGKSILKGGWNEDIKVEIDTTNDDLKISSEKLTTFRAKKEPNAKT